MQYSKMSFPFGITFKTLSMMAVMVAGAFAFGWTTTDAEAASSKRKARAKGTCSSITLARIMPETSRGGTFIYKSNWNRRANREKTYGEGNHALKGGALLWLAAARVHPNTQTINIMDSKRNIIGKAGRFPRCTTFCGDHERWYFRAPGSSYDTIATIARKARQSSGTSRSLIFRQGNGTCVRINDPYNPREVNF